MWKSRADVCVTLVTKLRLWGLFLSWFIKKLPLTRAMAMDRSENEIAIPPPIPDKLQDLIYGFRASKTLFAACDLGIFDILHDSETPQSAQDISANIKADPEATTRFMDALVGLELLEKTKPREAWLYTNTEMASQFLTKSSPDSVGGYIRHSNTLLYPLFGNLETAVKEGSNQWVNTFGMSSGDVWEDMYKHEEDRLRFLGAMHSSARRSCHSLAGAFDLSEFKTCCDLGGGTGALSYTLSQYFPNMKITICELSSVVTLAHHFQPSLEDCPNQGNVTFVVGDFFQPNLPKADLYVIMRVFPDWSGEEVKLILHNVSSCMSAGNALLIYEMMLDDDKTGPKACHLQNLNMLVQTQGKERSIAEYRQLLQNHGFVSLQFKRLGAMGAILCRKAG